MQEHVRSALPALRVNLPTTGGQSAPLQPLGTHKLDIDGLTDGSLAQRAARQRQGPQGPVNPRGNAGMRCFLPCAEGRLVVHFARTIPSELVREACALVRMAPCYPNAPENPALNAAVGFASGQGRQSGRANESPLNYNLQMESSTPHGPRTPSRPPTRSQVASFEPPTPVAHPPSAANHIKFPSRPKYDDPQSDVHSNPPSRIGCFGRCFGRKPVNRGAASFKAPPTTGRARVHSLVPKVMPRFQVMTRFQVQNVLCPSPCHSSPPITPITSALRSPHVQSPADPQHRCRPVRRTRQLRSRMPRGSPLSPLSLHAPSPPPPSRPKRAPPRLQRRRRARLIETHPAACPPRAGSPLRARAETTTTTGTVTLSAAHRGS